MSGPNSQPDPRRLATTSDAARGSVETPLPAVMTLLEQVLSETAAGQFVPGAVEPAIAGALDAVARRHRGAAMQLDPVGVELLEALLAAQFPVLASRGELLSQAARAVGTSLLADPTARLRLEHLWAILGERLE